MLKFQKTEEVIKSELQVADFRLVLSMGAGQAMAPGVKWYLSVPATSVRI